MLPVLRSPGAPVSNIHKTKSAVPVRDFRSSVAQDSIFLTHCVVSPSNWRRTFRGNVLTLSSSFQTSKDKKDEDIVLSPNGGSDYPVKQCHNPDELNCSAQAS
jgi:hypothetical protein